MKNSFDTFMSKNYQTFFWYCNRTMSQTAEDADEIVSEAFCRMYFIWEQRKDYDEIKNKKWMYHAIDNIIKEYKRKRKKHLSDNIEDYVDLIPDAAYIDENIEYQECITAIESELSKSDTEIFRLCYIERIPYSQICKRLNINDQALRTRISRLRKRIEKIVEKRK